MSAPSHGTWQITPMRRDDLPDVMAIEIASFALPWTEEMFLNELSRGTLSELFVARLPGAGAPPPLGGYICLWLVSDELHINNLAVHPRWRRHGIAAALLEAALAHGRADGARAAFLEVRASNAAAQGLYRRFHFAPVGVRTRYYTHPVEDALIMRREPV
jgi:[ribosomal protein S18]-alanine N-acetyltransferase